MRFVTSDPMRVVVAVAMLLASGGLARADDIRAEARTHFGNGMKLLDHGDKEEALKEFEAAYALIPSPKIQFNMGIAHQALGHSIQALEAFDAFLAGATDDIPQEKRDQASKHRRELLARVAAITIVCDRPGVTVSIDGVVRGKTPFAGPVYAEPGAHRLLAERAGLSPATQTFAATRGTELALPISLVAAPVAARPAETTVTTKPAPPAVARSRPIDLRPHPIDEPTPIVESNADSPPSSGSWRGPVKWTSFGLAAVGVTVGVLETLTAIQKSKDFNNVTACMDDGNGHIRGGTACVQISHDQTLATWLAVASYGAAGALMTTGLILHFSAPDAESPSAPAKTVACGLGASLTGATCVARW